MKYLVSQLLHGLAHVGGVAGRNHDAIALPAAHHRLFSVQFTADIVASSRTAPSQPGHLLVQTSSLKTMKSMAS